MENKCIIKKTALLVFLCTLAHIGFASNVSIKGIVFSNIDSLIIVNARIDLFDADSALIKTTYSNINGIFEFEEIQYTNGTSCFLQISKIEFKDSYITISGILKSSINVGNIYLNPLTVELGEVNVTTSYIIDKADKMIVFPMAYQVKASSGSMDLLRNLNLPSLNIDIVNQQANIDGLAPIYQVNGRPQSREQILGLKPSDIARIEYGNTVPIRYMNQNIGGVINFILKEKVTGGSFFTNNTVSPLTGFLNGVVSTSFNYKKSDFSILYNNNWRDYTKRYIDKNESLIITDEAIISRDFLGIYSPFGYLSQDLNLNYTYQHDPKTMLSIIVGNSFGSQHDESKSNVSERSSNSTTEFYREANAYFDSYSPSLDIFFSKKLENNQTIEFNTVGTLLNSTGKRHLYDDETLQINNKIENQRQSIIWEGVYSKDFKNYSFKSGIRYMNSYTKNDYINTVLNTTEMNVQNSYLFAQLIGKTFKFSYDIGIGLRIYEVDNKISNKSYSKSVVTANLLYPITKDFRVSYRFQLDPSLPSLSQLSNVVQNYDSISVLKGNPGLNPFNTIRNRLLFTYSKNKVRANLWLSHTKSNNPITLYTYYDSFSQLFTSEYQNQYHDEKYNTQLDLSVNSLFNSISFSTSVGWNKFVASGQKYIHSLYNLYWLTSLTAKYQDFYLSVGYTHPQKNLVAETIQLGENNSYTMLMYRKKNYSFTLGIYYPFTDSWHTSAESISSVNPYRQGVYIKDNGNMLILGFSYQFNYGKSLNTSKKTLTNSDSDTGILKVQ
jgi:hypothetical protein